MGYKSKNKRKRRKDSSDSKHFSKLSRKGGTPEKGNLCMSDTHRDVKNVLHGDSPENIINSETSETSEISKISEISETSGTRDLKMGSMRSKVLTLILAVFF